MNNTNTTIVVGGSSTNNATQQGGRIRLTAKPHAFAGAVLSPKHAQELTPSLCLAIASALAQQQQQQASLQQQQQQQQQQLPHRRVAGNNAASVVPYTLWITEAWRVLGWAEPSAALFWEMATMFHALVMASHTVDGFVVSSIPPILSCSSASSVGSSANNSSTNNVNNDRATSVGGGSMSHHAASSKHTNKYTSTSGALAKELPIWLVGTFLLLHCEEYAYQRNLSGQDERRFGGDPKLQVSLSSSSSSSSGGGGGTNPNNNMDFTSLFKNTSLSPRTRLHAGWYSDTTHCTAYLLRHLRKILLLSGISNNPEAIRACMHLAAIPTPQVSSATSTTNMASSSTTAANERVNAINTGANASNNSTAYRNHRANVVNTPGAIKYSANDLRRQHDDEHGNVGMNVRLTMDDLEHLDFLLRLPSGGGIDDPPLRIADFIYGSIYQSSTAPHPTATIPLADVEREIRQHLEMELVMVGFDNEDKEGLSSDDEEEEESTTFIRDHHHSSKSKHHTDASNRERAKQPSNHYHKELSYTHLRGTTILLKPNPPEAISSGASATGSIEQTFGVLSSSNSGGRLHDIVISDCSDAHFYLLQPFEHATIASCTGCTIVVGAVAGLLHVVDCEKTNITSAARRILVCNSCDIQLCVFSPSPPLLVGDNRSCQLAPYNTYYDGLHEDLIATGLATPGPIPAISPEGQSPYHAPPTSRGVPEIDSAWPSLQKASNKWKHPVELSKLEVPQVPGSPAASGGSGGGVPNSPTGVASPGADDKAMSKTGGGNDAAMQAPVLVPPSEFHILFVPVETEASRLRRLEAEEAAATAGISTPLQGDTHNDNSLSASTTPSAPGANDGSQYCRLLAEVLQLSPFRLPIEYERRVLMKAERMKNIQQAVQKKLTIDQQRRFEEELNRGFRDWLVTSGNLRQVLDLVHLERRGGV